MGKKWDSFSNNTNSALGGQSPANKKEKTPFQKRGKPISGWCEKDKISLKNFQLWCEEWAKEALRVAKPGAFMLVFGGTRTAHRLACGIEDAGWQIRDQIDWIYGSGFPKSLDIGKAYDKKMGNERIPYERPDFVARSNKKEQRKSQVICGEKGKYTKGNSQWEGYGTALKPAHEPIIVAMKPIEGSFAENTMKYDVGGLNIDGSRISHNEEIKLMKKQDGGNKIYKQSGRYKETTELKEKGRWPANIIFQHHPECECVGTKKVKGVKPIKSDINPYESNRTWSVSKTKDNDKNRWYADENGQETIEDWNCFKGFSGVLPFYSYKNDVVSPLSEPSYLLDQLLFLTQVIRDCSKIYTSPLPHVSEFYHNVYKQLVGSRDAQVCEISYVLRLEEFLNSLYDYQFCRHFCDELIQMILISCQDGLPSLYDVLVAVHHFLLHVYTRENQYLFHHSNEDDSFLEKQSIDIYENNIFVESAHHFPDENMDERLFCKQDISVQDSFLIPNNKYVRKISEIYKREKFYHKTGIFVAAILPCFFVFDLTYRFLPLPFNIIKNEIDVNINSCPIRILNEQSGITKSGAMKRNVPAYEGESHTKFLRGESGPQNQHGDFGGASRFFKNIPPFYYVPKASRSERNHGCEDLPEKLCQTGCGGDMPLDDQGKERDRFKKITTNTHPTVKPLKLLKYLTNLISQPKTNLILDLFAGSGTTGVACEQLKLPYILIEKEEEYIPIIKARVKAANTPIKKHKKITKKKSTKSDGLVDWDEL